MHYLILGGGSAGCVLAARLAEDTNNRVTLIEAGIDVTLDSMAPHIRSRYAGRAFGEIGRFERVTRFGSFIIWLIS